MLTIPTSTLKNVMSIMFNDAINRSKHFLETPKKMSEKKRNERTH